MPVTLKVHTDYTTVHGISVKESKLLEDALRYFSAAASPFNPSFSSGKWDGFIRLYDRFRGQFPTGLLTRVKHIFKRENIEFTVEKALPDLPSPHPIQMASPDELRAYQEEAVMRAVDCRRGIIRVPTGGGKTLIAQHIIHRTQTPRAIFLVPNRVLLNQTYKRFKAVFPDCNVVRWGDGYKPESYIGEDYILVSTVQTAWKQSEQHHAFKDATAVIIDECFPAGTPVDGFPIETLKPGYAVRSYNETLEATEYRRVKTVSRRKPKALLRLRIANGSEIVCTPNHPFWVGNGYVPACQLNAGDFLYGKTSARQGRTGGMRSMQDARSSGGTASESSGVSVAGTVPPSGLGLLHTGMPECGTLETVFSEDDRNQPETQGSTIRSDAGTKPDEERGGSGQGENDAAPYELETQNERGEWTPAHGTATVARFRLGVADRGHCKDERDDSHQSAESLQNRYCGANPEDSGRGGRRQSWFAGTTGARSKERSDLSRIRLDSIEVLEPTGDGTFGGSCPDGYVYSIEVEGNENYYANGILVHNCHHQAADTFQQATKHCGNARYLLGLSATPFRDDGADLEMEAWLGPVIYEIGYEELIAAGYLVPPEFHTVHNLDEAITKTKNMRTLIFAEKVADLEAAKVAFQRHGVVVHTGKSKTADIRQSIDDLIAKQITHIAATPIFDEGLDVPEVDAVVFYATGRSRVRTLQRIGRAMRPAPGKEKCVVVDLLDKSYPDRRATYQKEPAFAKRLK